MISTKTEFGNLPFILYINVNKEKFDHKLIFD